MGNSKKDTLGRATFHSIEPRRHVRPTAREIRWLKHLERHGPQSSYYLHELTADTHRDRDTSRRQLQKLRAGGLIHCPRQQRATERANFNAYVYDLADDGRHYLIEHGLDEATVRPHGHWAHQFMTACITGAIDIAAARAGSAYIPTHKILERQQAPLSFEFGRRKLIPDQLFGLDYGGKFRFFCVEADRGTEPKQSSAPRKSYKQMIEQYAEFIGERRYQAHYGLTANMLLLVVFSSSRNRDRFLEMARSILGEHSAYILTQVIPGFHDYFRPPPLLTSLFDQPWERARHRPIPIDLP